VASRSGEGAIDRSPLAPAPGSQRAFFAEVDEGVVGVEVDLRHLADVSPRCRYVLAEVVHSPHTDPFLGVTGALLSAGALGAIVILLVDVRGLALRRRTETISTCMQVSARAHVHHDDGVTSVGAASRWLPVTSLQT
jgi:hypothetical protein